MGDLTYRHVETSRLRFRIAERGEGPPVILLHGFPESAYSWRHQLVALADAGFRAIAPDQRGYGGTDAPPDIEAYDQVELAADVVALCDALGIERAAVVGHDWGSPVAWHTALLHPDRVSAVVALSVPHGGRPPAAPTSIFKKRMGDVFFYMLYFQRPGVAEAEIEANVRESLRVFYYAYSGDAPPGSAFVPQPKTAKLFDTIVAPPGLPPWLTEEDLQVYVSTFERSGFRGPLNWYRNLDRSWERTADLAGKHVRQPALFIAGDRDPVILFSQPAMQRMPDVVPRLVGKRIVEGAGHWIQQERPAFVNEEIVSFLRSIDRT
jgi:pimeloyl-ACP methyl ester carboxylesterase